MGGREDLCKPDKYSVGFIVPPEAKMLYLGNEEYHGGKAEQIVREMFPKEYKGYGLFRGKTALNYLMEELGYIRVANFSKYEAGMPLQRYPDSYWRMIVLMVDRLTKACQEENEGNFVEYIFEYPEDYIKSNNRTDFMNKLRYKNKPPKEYRTSELSQFRESLSRIIFEEIMKEI